MFADDVFGPALAEKMGRELSRYYKVGVEVQFPTQPPLTLEMEQLPVTSGSPPSLH